MLRMALTDKQIRFCEEYLIDLNATQAAIRAGYSEKTANEQGSQNLAKLSIQERITELKKERSTRTEITSDRVLQEMARLAFLDHRKFYDENGNLKAIPDLDDDTAAALAGFEQLEEKTGSGDVLGFTKKIKTHDKSKVLEMLGRHLGMFEKDNDQQNKNITVNIV
jgi:phage terminase small subunit